MCTTMCFTRHALHRLTAPAMEQNPDHRLAAAAQSAPRKAIPDRLPRKARAMSESRAGLEPIPTKHLLRPPSAEGKKPCAPRFPCNVPRQERRLPLRTRTTKLASDGVCIGTCAHMRRKRTTLGDTRPGEAASRTPRQSPRSNPIRFVPIRAGCAISMYLDVVMRAPLAQDRHINGTVYDDAIIIRNSRRSLHLLGAPLDQEAHELPR